MDLACRILGHRFELFDLGLDLPEGYRSEVCVRCALSRIVDAGGQALQAYAETPAGLKDVTDQVRSAEPDRDIFRFVRGGGTLVPVGIFMFIFGVAVTALISYHELIRPADAASSSDRTLLSLLGVALLGGGIMLGGTVLTLGRIGVVVDRKAGRVTRWCGLLRPMLHREWPVSAFDRVTVAREPNTLTLRSRYDTTPAYIVRLKGTEADVRLCDVRGAEGAQARAKGIADTLGLKLEDRIAQSADEIAEREDSPQKA